MPKRMIALRIDEDLLAQFDALAVAAKKSRTAALEHVMRMTVEGNNREALKLEQAEVTPRFKTSPPKDMRPIRDVMPNFKRSR